MTQTILEKLKDGSYTLRKSEQKVANWIAENPNQAVILNITTLAKYSEVSEPTIVRFCRAIGFKGFQEFKVRFAEDLAYGKANKVDAITEHDSLDELKVKVAQYARSALSHIEGEIKTDELEKAVSMISKAKKVVICGFGASNCTAFDLYHKMSRMTDKAEYHPDMHMSMTAVGSLVANDVIIPISNSGKSEALVTMCKTARSNGVNVISITHPGSSVDQYATARLNIPQQKDTGLFFPMSFRLKQLTVADFLVYGYAKANAESAQLRLQQSKVALKGLKQSYSII